jgi:phosphatidylethanolamine-binding protein (PEBP) family uncharacterized protein
MGAALAATMPAHAFAFSISVDWTGTAACFDRQSPVIHLADVPKGTAKIKFRMTDLQAPRFPHGGGAVAYSGQASLAKGAFAYKGPCPPSPHRYHWVAEALDTAGHVIGRAATTLKFPP